jgi:hypothetical protein
MGSLPIDLDDDVAEAIRRLAQARRRSESDVIREALAVYERTSRPEPIGVGCYHSGGGGIAERAREILREDAKAARWP